jgi:hypothetical protein
MSHTKAGFKTECSGDLASMVKLWVHQNGTSMDKTSVPDAQHWMNSALTPHPSCPQEIPSTSYVSSTLDSLPPGTQATKGGSSAAVGTAPAQEKCLGVVVAAQGSWCKAPGEAAWLQGVKVGGLHGRWGMD